MDVVRIDRRWRIRAHTAGIEPLIAVKDALVILSRHHWLNGLTIGEGQHADLLTDQKFFDDHAAARSTKFIIH